MNYKHLLLVALSFNACHIAFSNTNRVVGSENKSKNIELANTDKTQIKQNKPSRNKNTSYTLDAVTAVADTENIKAQKKYQSGSHINTRMIESNPSGNGDIGSLLRTLPNVQFDNSQLKSTTPGEIDPAKISISGGVHYQNLFTLDGFNMNNDLDPAGGGSWVGGTPGRSQGLAVDTSLLESINVQDSNVSAAYGGFMGGVVEANLRRPSKKFGAKASYQITQGSADKNSFSLTNYHLYGTANPQAFLESFSDSNQPNFIKHLFRANIESKVNDKFGFLAAFSTTQSIIPLRRSDNSSDGDWATPIDPADQKSAKQDQKRQIYNYLLKAYYDPIESMRIEASYTYAPQYDYRFLVGTKDDFYSFDSGGHQFGLKATWDNDLGTLTSSVGYSFLENSTDTNFNATKYWQASDSKKWSNWATWVREGGYAPSISMQQTLSNKIVQDFSAIDFYHTEHTFQVGIELNYQYASFGFSKPYDSAVKSSTFIGENQVCTDTQWCDTAKAYDPRNVKNLEPDKIKELIDKGVLQAMSGSTEQNKYANGIIWLKGQYFNQLTRFDSTKDIALHNAVFGMFFQDDINIDFGNQEKFGALNLRPGLRIDTDSYMGKLTAGHRFSFNYEFPHNTTQIGSSYKTQIIGGINRYYGRNLFSYRLADGMNSLKTDIRRDDPAKTWESILATGKVCQDKKGQPDTNCIETYKNQTKFSKLKVPYVDEYVIGFGQGLGDFGITAKYIHRQGKDDITNVRSDYANLPPDPNYSERYYIYTNDGKSWSDIVTLSIENGHALEFYGIKNYFLFAFDWTNVRRNFLDYASSLTSDQLEDNDILYEGQVIAYSQRPASNFMRPYTIRLSTTHTFSLWKTKWILNNFFRFRSSYSGIARIHTAGTQYKPNGGNREPPPGYDPNHNDKDQYLAQEISAAFTWDMRLGCEIDIHKNIMFINVDIFNVLDAKNPTILQENYAGTARAPTLAYEIGRQFWLELGYRF